MPPPISLSLHRCVSDRALGKRTERKGQDEREDRERERKKISKRTRQVRAIVSADFHQNCFETNARASLSPSSLSALCIRLILFFSSFPSSLPTAESDDGGSNFVRRWRLVSLNTELECRPARRSLYYSRWFFFFFLPSCFALSKVRAESRRIRGQMHRLAGDSISFHFIFFFFL